MEDDEFEEIDENEITSKAVASDEEEDENNGSEVIEENKGKN